MSNFFSIYGYFSLLPSCCMAVRLNGLTKINATKC